MRLYRTLLILATLLALGVISLGAYVRLSDAGLGCPDWPGCYGHLIGVPDTAHEQSAAQQAFPGNPVETHKAWKEMIHRYFAGSLGLLIAAITGLAWKNRRTTSNSPWAATALLGIVVLQALLGMWTVTPQPGRSSRSKTWPKPLPYWPSTAAGRMTVPSRISCPTRRCWPCRRKPNRKPASDHTRSSTTTPPKWWSTPPPQSSRALRLILALLRVDHATFTPANALRWCRMEPDRHRRHPRHAGRAQCHFQPVSHPMPPTVAAAR